MRAQHGSWCYAGRVSLPVAARAVAPEAKHLGYLLVLAVPACLALAAWLGHICARPDLLAWLPVVALYGVLPVMDYLIGRDTGNPTDHSDPALRHWSYRLLLLAMVPLQLGVLTWAVGQFEPLGLIGRIGWLESVGICSGIIAINVAHELIHKRERLDRLAGGVLLASVCYAGFKVEHLRGHHVHVATPNDPSSARLGQSVYRFVAQALVRNTANAWRLEAARLRTLGLPWWHWRNELLGWYGLSAAFLAAFWFTAGVTGAVFFLGQSLLAAASLESINYIEHYGLRRKRLPDGRYERPNPSHSWNSSYLLSNLILLQLQRHSDHHAHPRRPYQRLRHHEASPQLPGGYAAMLLLALVPPLWFRVMDPRVRTYYANASASP